jgi:hypothetical protein
MIFTLQMSKLLSVLMIEESVSDQEMLLFVSCFLSLTCASYYFSPLHILPACAK